MPAEKREDWFFLRGLVRESAHWDDLPQRFARAYPLAAVHCIDLPGNGRHFRAKSPLSVPALARFAKSESDRLRREVGATPPFRPAYLFSISLGSMVALEWLRMFPYDMKGAVLTNVSLRRFSAIYRRLLPSALPKLLKIAFDRNAEGAERKILALTSNLTEWTEAVVDRRIEARKQRPVSLANSVRQLVAASTYTPPAQAPACPILLLNSEKDRLVDPSCSVALHEKWNLEMRRHPNAGHDLPLDDPEWVLSEVVRWRKTLP